MISINKQNINNNDESSIEIISQYISNKQLLSEIEKLIPENYINFIKFCKPNINISNSIEDYLINNISNDYLLKLIKDYDKNIYDTVINQLLNSIY